MTRPDRSGEGPIKDVPSTTPANSGYPHPLIRFAADENLNDFIVRGLLRRHPGLDIVRIRETEMRAAGDPAVLDWAAGVQRLFDC